MLVDPKQAERELRTLMEAGTSLGDALRRLHHERGLGLMFLWPAVMTIQRMSKDEAMRLVIRETSRESV